jgi:hypothetical protein
MCIMMEWDELICIYAYKLASCLKSVVTSSQCVMIHQVSFELRLLEASSHSADST